MKRIFLLLVAILLVLPAFVTTVVAEAAPQVSVAQRELKKDKNYRSSDLYARAHHIIYGSKAPLGLGDVYASVSSLMATRIWLSRIA